MSPLKFDLIAPPYHGHLHPMLGLANTLQTFGTVRIISTPDGADRARSLGFDACGVLANHAAAVWSIPNTTTPVRGKPWMLLRQLKHNLRLLPVLHSDLESAWAARRPDIAVVDFTLPMAGHWARSAGIRWWTSHPSPLAIESTNGTPSYCGGWRPPTTAAGRARDALGRLGVRAFKRFAFAACRQELRALGLPGPYRSDGTEQVYSDERILALGMRELEFERQWPASVSFVGPVLFTPAASVSPCPVTLDPSRKNVIVTIGTHLPYARERMLKYVENWARSQPGIFWHYTTGGLSDQPESNGENWRTYSYINYETDLPKFDAVVHHGGAGIAYYALRAALPAVVWPQDYDQFDFAARLAHREVALWSKRADQIPAAVERALTDRVMTDRAKRFAQLLGQYDLRAQLLRLLQAK